LYTLSLPPTPNGPPSIVERLRTEPSVVAAELRPPRAELETRASMDAWIDTYHAVRSLTREGTPVFLTDSAVGLKEEDNLRHLVSNLGSEVSRHGVVPFLTCKHPLEYCTAYADRAVQHGFQALVVLGGDKSVGPPRCVGHAWQLREEIRKHQPHLLLGGWANPHGNIAQQVGHLLDEHATAEFYLTQIVSHHSRDHVREFVAEAGRRGLAIPGIFGIFYYRSANPRTLEALESFLPVPAGQLTAEFAAGATADEICARTIRALREAGARHFYVSNLPLQRAARTLSSILSRAGT
jgi:5,10-methylenetetrahydrofolate reductase